MGTIHILTRGWTSDPSVAHDFPFIFEGAGTFEKDVVDSTIDVDTLLWMYGVAPSFNFDALNTSIYKQQCFDLKLSLAMCRGIEFQRINEELHTAMCENLPSMEAAEVVKQQPDPEEADPALEELKRRLGALPSPQVLVETKQPAPEAIIVNDQRMAIDARVLRLRKRGVRTNRLEAYLNPVGKSSVKAEISVVAWFKQVLGQCKVLDYSFLDREEYNDNEPGDSSLPGVCLARLETLEGDVLVCVELLAKLQGFVALRRRTVELISSMRARALTWCNEQGMNDLLVSRLLAGTLAIAFRTTIPEYKATRLLGAQAVQIGVSEMESLSQGVPKPGYLRDTRTKWEQWRSIFRFAPRYNMLAARWSAVIPTS